MNSKKNTKFVKSVFLFCLFSSLILVSCKTKTILVEGNANTKLEADRIIFNHYNNKKDFSTLYIKSSAHYEDEKQSHNVTAEIKIKKDEIILVSIRFLGITMAKALITPIEVKYYEKLGSHFFEGNYQTLSQWLGTDLDYQKIQNMLVGQALDNLKNQKFISKIEDKLYKLENNSNDNTRKTYFFESEKFLLKKEEISQEDQERKVEISYPNYTTYDQIILPTSIVIDAFQKKGKTNIQIEYKSVTFNEELSFPYSVPEGYQKITIE